MKIDSDDLKARAKKFIELQNAARISNMNYKKNIIIMNANAISVQLDAIRAVAPAVYELYDSKMLRDIGDFFTDGCSHCLGFSNRRKNAIGCCGGGASGKSLFVDFETGKFIVSNWHDENNSKTISANELSEKYWNNDSILVKVRTIAEGLANFAESAAMKIMSLAQ